MASTMYRCYTFHLPWGGKFHKKMFQLPTFTKAENKPYIEWVRVYQYCNIKYAIWFYEVIENHTSKNGESEKNNRSVPEFIIMSEIEMVETHSVNYRQSIYALCVFVYQKQPCLVIAIFFPLHRCNINIFFFAAALTIAFLPCGQRAKGCHYIHGLMSWKFNIFSKQFH